MTAEVSAKCSLDVHVQLSLFHMTIHTHNCAPVAGYATGKCAVGLRVADLLDEVRQVHRDEVPKLHVGQRNTCAADLRPRADLVRPRGRVQGRIQRLAVLAAVLTDDENDINRLNSMYQGTSKSYLWMVV